MQDKGNERKSVIDCKNRLKRYKIRRRNDLFFSTLNIASQKRPHCNMFSPRRSSVKPGTGVYILESFSRALPRNQDT